MTKSLCTSAIALLAATSLTATTLHAQSAPPLDESTQTRPTQNAPDPQVDYLDLTLHISMPDPASRSFVGTESLSFKTKRLPLTSLTLNGVGMAIESVRHNGDAVDFRHDGELVTIDFKEPLELESEHALQFVYEVTKPKAGMTFAIPDEAYPDRPLHIHTQGQPEQNRNWVICHDYPNERMRTHISVTVPADLKVLANGELEGVADAEDGLKTWNYSLKQPHVSYLMSVVIGEFDVVDLEEWEDIGMQAWVPPGRADDAERTFGRTLNMMEFYSDKLGRYPWPTYHQSVVYMFGSGGMENTTVTTLYQDAILDERAHVGSTLDGLIAHELAHQWFGDHTTCKTWGHLWLNEGFATWLDAAWHEHYFGTDEYGYELFTTMRRVAEGGDVTANGGLIWPYYDQPRQTFRRRESNPYSKGCSVIHMMREHVKMQGGTDDDFWAILRIFQDNHGLSDVESDELRRELEDYTGRDWELFFQQWVVRPGNPKFDVKYAWTGDAVKLTFEQTQPIDAHYPAFTGSLPVAITDANGNTQRFTVDIDGKRTVATLATGSEPAMVMIDPHNSMLSTVDFKPPFAMTVAAAKDAPTAFARLKAIDRLSDYDTPEAVDTLQTILGRGDLHWGQRAEAARSLNMMQTEAGRSALLTAQQAGVDDPKARRALAEAIGEYRHPDAAKALIEMTRDESVYAAAAACAGLGDQAMTPEILQTLLARVEDSPSGQGERIRQSAVAALARHGVPEALQPAMDLAAYGSSFRVRGTGISALATLHGQLDGEAQTQIREMLLGMADDDMIRHAAGAMRALGNTGDTEAISRLQQIASSARHSTVTTAARRAIETIRSGGADSDVLRDLRQRLDRLEERFDADEAEAREKALAPQN